MATLAKKIFWTPEPLVQIWNNYTWMFRLMPTTKIAQTVPLSLSNKMANRAKNRNILRWHILDHLSKFKTLSYTAVTVLCPWTRRINPCLVLVQPRMTHHSITDKIVDWDVKNQIISQKWWWELSDRVLDLRRTGCGGVQALLCSVLEQNALSTGSTQKINPNITENCWLGCKESNKEKWLSKWPLP